MRISRRTGALIFALTAPALSASAVTFTINTAQTQSISPYIYGINGTSVGNYTNPTFERTGGNRITAYNWTNNDSNAGSDWYFENDGAYSNSTTAGAGMASAIVPALTGNAGIVVAVPINGYVAKDRLGGNADVRYNPGTTTFDPNWLTDRFVPEQPAKPGGPASFTLTPSPTSTVVYEDEFVNWVKTTYPAGFTANTTTPIWFELDNEPDLWASTHAELRPVVPGSVTAQNPLGTPTPVTYSELLQKTIAYATAIKAVVPNTKIFGPVSYGWNGYTTLQNAPDSGADGDFLTYYLNQTAAASKSAGERLVDVLDLHWYPEATGAGIRITTADSGYSGSTLAALEAARIQAPRSLWDPTYVESSWITSSLGNQAIQLLPREQAKMTAAANTYGSAYAANQISISEYNYGGGDDISGGIAEADVLGIFGQRGVLSANEWPLASNESFIGGGFLMYRNYDGKGSTFGDISLATTNSSVANASIYASEYSTDNSRMTLVAINKTTSGLAAALALPNAPNSKPFTIALVYTLTAASPNPQFVDELFINNPSTFSYTMAGYSVNTIALSSASASVWATAASGSWNTTGNWTGGLPNAIGAIAAINASTTVQQTVTLSAAATVGTLFLGNPGSATAGYTLSGSGGNSLTLNNSGNGAVIAVSGGAQVVNAPVVLADNLQIVGGTTGWTLSFGATSIISGGYAVTMSGNGSVVLAGQNTYTGVTTLASGITNLGAAEIAGTSGPLGKSVATNHGSIVFSGGTLQYSSNNQNDYSGRFSTVANEFYSVDTNGQNVTWASGLTSSGGTLVKLGLGTLSLTSASTNLTAATVTGGGLTFSSGTISTLNLNTGAGSSTIGSGIVTTINVNAGGLGISGGTIGTDNYNASTGTDTISAGTVTTINVNAGGVNASGGTIGTFNQNTGAGTSTIGASATVTALNVISGTVNFNSTQANGTMTLPAGSTGTVIVGSATGGLLPKVATADFSSTPSTGTVNATHPLAITSTLKLPGGQSAILTGGTSFTATGANLANTSTASTLSLSGGTLTFPTGAASQSIAVHWSGYGNNTPTTISGTDGVVPQSHWTNVVANWYSGSASNLVNGGGMATTAAVTAAGNGAGTYWWSATPVAGIDNLVLGPGGGNGAVMNAITGIPFSSYEIIAYVNNYNAAGSQFAVWLDGNPTSSSQTNTPLAGSRYYYGATYTNNVGFVQLTNNTNASSYPNANYVIWTGLSGTSQTLWTEGWSSSGASSNDNEGITGFQIISTAGPASVNLPATAIAVTASSTLDLGEMGTPSQYHALGGLALTASSSAGTQLQLQHALNIDFNGISATYPSGGSGAKTASIVNGTTSPVISLAGGSSVSVDPNVTLTIGSTIGNPQSGTTALTKTGGGALTLTGNNTYTGATTVSAGTLNVNGSINTSSISVATGANLMVNGVAKIITTGTPNTAASTSVVSSLTIAGSTGAWTGKLDLGDNSMVIRNGGASVLNTVADAIHQGLVTDTVNHDGITSSTALTAPNQNTTLGYALASSLSSGSFNFEGQTVSGNDVLVKYTWKADANLDGSVNVADLGILATNYGKTLGQSWVTGDFNDDGSVNVADLGLLATYYGLGTGSSTPLLSFQDAINLFPQFGGGGGETGAAPEPASLGLLGLGAISLLIRRRGKSLLH